MALEFLPYGPLASLAGAAELCAHAGWDRCGLLLDSWHFFRSGEPWAELSSLSGDQVALLQVNDAPPVVTGNLAYESRFRRVLPGLGEFDLARFREQVVAIGYAGVVSPEVLSRELVMMPVQAAATDLRRSLAACWSTT